MRMSVIAPVQHSLKAIDTAGVCTRVSDCASEI